MMKKIQVAAGVALALSSVSVAQQAVQWKVSEGGNGHWYQFVPTSVRWVQADAAATTLGGHLATITSEQENQFLSVVNANRAAWLGGFQPTGACEPGCSWTWVTGESWSYSRWDTGQPDNASDGEHWLQYHGNDRWNDNRSVVSYPYIIEWSADCNNDGIVDYGQCRDGSLPDYNGDNIPDCCESGTACVVGNYPVQWRVEDGGNGHWYQVRPKVGVWEACRTDAHASGGNLGSLSTQQENDFVEAIIPALRGARKSVFLGGRQSARSSSSSEWYWIDGSTWSYTDWERNQPDGDEGYLAMYSLGTSVVWGDYPSDDSDICCFLVEWSADCNNDGIVDYGQILAGQLADSDGNGIPDSCETVTCQDADFFPDRNVNGADLGILLAQWGPATQYTVADLNRDGTVDGADLGIVLSFWGPCPY